MVMLPSQSPAGRAPLRALLLALTAAVALTPWLSANEAPDVPAGAASQKLRLRREGTQLHEEPGRFLPVGTRLTFVSARGTQYIGLENLNLERVGKIVATSTDALEWFVTGTVTEYQGTNYLLIARARRKASLPNTSSRRAF